MMIKKMDEKRDIVESWQEEAELHRWEAMQLIIHALNKSPEPVEAAVVGTGCWDDVDWTEITARVSNITVFDLGRSGGQSAVQGLTGPLSRKVTVHTNADLIGLEQVRFQERFQSLLESGAEPGQLIAFLGETGEHVKQARPLEQIGRQFSLVVSLPVYTQLFYIDAMLMLAPYMENYGPEQTAQLTRQISSVRDICVEAYNRVLFSMLKPGGRIVIWSDMMIVNEQTQQVMDELYMERTEKERVRRIFTAFGQYGMEAAIAGMKGAFDRMNPEQTHFTTWLWPLGRDKQFVAAGLAGSGIQA
ncbi:hypothetical protein [Paenibacillus hamazuiensis]|uniref:hypothetical protein n=1 Tax=Paenibacillus hamazuiensis TaxID=2936508 RepID=UPI00200BD8C7|nr:hypothetical protein [Paenibacillus hamazuiensis]